MTDPNRALSTNTTAYLRLRAQTQAVFDFAVVVDYAVAALKRQVRLLETGIIKTLPKPDYYGTGTSSPDELRLKAQGYKQQLASYALLSIFSFFESFVVSAVKEMLAFHGGVDALSQRADARDAAFLVDNPRFEAHKQRLRGRNPDHLARYRKHSLKLNELGYRFPSELFSSYGVRTLAAKIGNLRASDIPDLLKHGLHMPLSDDRIAKFHDVREIRNRIAHGEPVALSLAQVREHNRRLRKLAYDIDRHLVSYFMIPEKYL